MHLIDFNPNSTARQCHSFLTPWQFNHSALSPSYSVRREKVLAFSRVEVPPGKGSLQPEAVGAAVEVTKLSKPSMSKGRFSGSANRQAVT